MSVKVRYEELLPHEMEATMVKTPIAYLPFGTLEWHGPHLALGNDAVKVHELCLRIAEKAGGVVVPATYWAIGGMPHPWTTRFDEELIKRLFYAIFEQMAHVGFKVIIALTGHYGFKQYYALKKIALSFMYKSNLIIAALPEFEVVYDKGYHGDHAAKWETSILWALRPELVDMNRLSQNLEEPLEGVGGEDPRIHASQHLGAEIVNCMVDRLAELALRLLNDTDSLNRSRFIQAFDSQLRIFDEIQSLKLREPRNLRKIIEADYSSFLGYLWNGNYLEAVNKASQILRKIRNYRQQGS